MKVMGMNVPVAIIDPQRVRACIDLLTEMRVALKEMRNLDAAWLNRTLHTEFSEAELVAAKEFIHSPTKLISELAQECFKKLEKSGHKPQAKTYVGLTWEAIANTDPKDFSWYEALALFVRKNGLILNQFDTRSIVLVDDLVKDEDRDFVASIFEGHPLVEIGSIWLP